MPPDERIAPPTELAPAGGPGSGHVGIGGIVLIVGYLVAVTLLSLYALIALWPVPTPSRSSVRAGPPAAAPTSSSSAPTTLEQAATEPSEVALFGCHFEIWDEVRLLLLVIFAGALGSLVQALRSIYWYVGNRELVWSWLAKYFLLPFAGSALAVIFYVVVRGGFFSPQAKFQQTSPFGFAALAALVGLFSEQAVLKLKEVAETLLTRPATGKNPAPPQRSGTP